MASEGDSSSTQFSDDPAWGYNNLEDDDGITCLFCNKVSRGGIEAAKQHQIRCSLCPQDVKDELIALIKKQKSKKSVVVGFGKNEDEDDDDVIKIAKVEKKRSGVYIGGQEKRLKSNGEATSFKQTNMNDVCDKELRAKAVQVFARFFYEAGIPFNAVKLDSFKEMIEAIGKCGPSFKAPSYHELRGPLLKKAVADMNQWIKGHKETWSKLGCSIMLNGWTDSEKRTLINILVNSSKGTVFMQSVDASSFTSSHSVCRLLERFVDRIGEANVVQAITDSRSTSFLAGKMLMATRPNLFWTPCAAHCIDLMLEDICNIVKVKKTIRRAIYLVGYIYNRRGVLKMMRGFTDNKELTRNGITRFATTYLSLLSLHKQHLCLERMFVNEKWTKSVWAKEGKGKTARNVVYMPVFWKNVAWILKVMGPLVRALRLVKNEKKPAMGYVYKAMDNAKEAIRSAFNKDDDLKVVYDIIDQRWECQLRHPLHAAGYYFNPEFYCTNPNIEKDPEVMKGLIACIQTLVPNHEKQDLVMKELIKWVDQAGLFSDDLAVRSRGKITPADWWKLYGKEIPNVQELAIKVLSLPCSSSSFERNWSPFEHINSKKMTQLESKRLQDLVFVRYNITLKSRHTKDVVYDPIALEDIDYTNEWMIGKMEEDQALGNQDLTRVDVVNEGSEDEEEEVDPDEFPCSNDNGTLVDWVGVLDDDDEDDDDDDYDDDDAAYL